MENEILSFKKKLKYDYYNKQRLDYYSNNKSKLLRESNTIQRVKDILNSFHIENKKNLVVICPLKNPIGAFIGVKNTPYVYYPITFYLKTMLKELKKQRDLLESEKVQMLLNNF